MTLYSVMPVIFAAICLTVAFYEFLTWLRLKGTRADLAFALMCVAATVYDVACAADYNADAPLRSILWLRTQAIALCVAGFALVWYLSGRTGMVSSWALWLVLGWCGVGALIQILGLGDLTWVASRPLEVPLSLPFGLDIVYRQVESGVFTNLQYYSGFLIFLYIVSVIVRFWRTGNRREAAYLSGMIIVFFAAFASDLLVAMRLYTFPYMLEYAWLAAVVFIGVQRANQLLEAARARRDLLVSEEKLRTFIEQSSEAIVMTDENGTVIEYNRAAEQLSGMRREDIVGIPIWRIAVHVHDSNGKTLDGLRELEERYRGILRSPQADTPPGPMEGSLRRPDGSTREYRQNLFPIRTASGVRIGSISYDITEAKRAQERVVASLEEKSVLLKEVHHRVKNNLQVVSSLLYLQESRMADARHRAILEECRDQIQSMALIHEDLYRSQDFRSIDFASYIRSLVQRLLDLYAPRGAVSFVPEVRSLTLTIDQAIPCALIVNELCTNALKHAFPVQFAGSHRELRVEMGPVDGDRVRLTVADNGVGLPADVDLATERSLGMRIVSKLVDQIHGTIHMGRGAGTRVEVEFPRARDPLPAAGDARASESISASGDGARS